MSSNTNLSQLSDSDSQENGKFLTAFQRKILLKNLQSNLESKYRRRIEVMLLADQGKSQTQICKTLGCSYHMARYWIGVAKAGLAHKWQDQPIGRPKSVNEQYLERLKELVSHSPREYGYPFQCWTAQWLSKHLGNEFGIEITERHLSRLLKQMGLSTKQRHDSPKQESNNTQESGITIGDLQLPSDQSLKWSLNFMKTSY